MTDQATRKLTEIASIIETVDDRCMAADGPVSRTADEMTDAEWQTIYRLATGRKLTKKHKAILKKQFPDPAKVAEKLLQDETLDILPNVNNLAVSAVLTAALDKSWGSSDG